MAHDFLKARKMAPPRPHPMAPQSGGLAQKAAGMQANLHDKVSVDVCALNSSSLTSLFVQVIETLQGREYVNLKLAHPENI